MKREGKTTSGYMNCREGLPDFVETMTIPEGDKEYSRYYCLQQLLCLEDKWEAYCRGAFRTKSINFENR